MSPSYDIPPFDIATDNTDTPANVYLPPVPQSTTGTTDTPANVDLPPVPHASTPSDSATIVTTFLELGFIFASGEESLPVDEQCEHLTTGSLRQFAAYLWESHVRADQDKDSAW